MLSFQNNRAIIPTVLIILLAGLGRLLKLDAQTAFRYGLFAFMTFMVYEVGVMLMYEFSMSYTEVVAQNGADYLRYNDTIVSFLVVCLLDFVWTIRRELSCPKHITQETVGLGTMVAVAVLVGIVLMPGIQRIVGRETIAAYYPEWTLFEKIGNEIRFTAEDTVLVRYNKDYGVPSNGTNYYVLPCSDLTNAWSVPEIEWRLSEGSYTYIIDLV